MISLGLLIAAVIYSLFAWRQWAAIKEQALIANKTLLLQVRPKLIVRNVVIEPAISEGGPNQTFIFLKNYPVAGQFYVANIGSSAARVSECFCVVHWQQGPLPMHPPYEALGTNTPITGWVKNAEQRTVPFTSDKSLDISHAELGSIDFPGLEPKWHIWVMGWITYSDQFGSGYWRTTFCRRYDHRTNRFVIEDDPDYEHAE